MTTSLLPPKCQIAAIFVVLMVSRTLYSETILFENGVMGLSNSNPITSGSSGSYAASNPFNITGGGVFNTISFEHWTRHPATPTSVIWQIGDAAMFYGNTLASGTAELDWEFIQAFNGIYDIYRSTFSIADFTAANGTQYWLTLYGAEGSGPLYTNWGWAAGGAGNVAYLYNDGSVSGNRQSHYFQLSYAVPEPSTACLFMTGVLLVMTSIRRRG